MKKYIISAIIALTAFAQTSLAQTTLRGKVVDEKGEAVVGATILNKATGGWATTTIDGTYTLEGKTAKGNIIEVTSLGYNTRTITFEGGQTLDIVLSEDAMELDETIVIGYGSVKKKDLTGSVGIVDKKLIEQQSVSQLSQALQGAIPGLQVTRTSSMPGASASVQVRGVTTIGDSSPLVLVDGMIGSLDNVAPDDVDQITVLKDAAAASIYGARAAAGVILITTKTAHEGDVHINYNGEYSMIRATEWADYLTDPINYMVMFNEYKWNDAGNGIEGDYQTYPKEYIESYMANNALDPIEYPNFDWLGNMLKSHASRQKHSLTAAYGNKVIKSRISTSYEKTDALYEGSSHERMNVRMRNTIKVNKFLSADVDFAFRHATKYDPTSNPLRAANMYPSVYLGLYPDGRFAPGKSGSNTLATIREGGFKSSRNDYVTGKISLSYKPFEGFDITAGITPTYSFTKGKTFSKKLPYYDAYDTGLILGYVSNHTTNDLTESRSDNNTFMTNVVASYDKSAGKHNFNFMAGYEDYSNYTESMSSATTDMELGNFPFLNLANKDNLSTSGSAHEYAYRSFFGRAMYNYDNRYYLQLNFRHDRSSRFHKNYRGASFPSASLGWVISNEGFMQNVKPISYLKLRASVGALGNERINTLDDSGSKSAVYYAYQSTINFSNAIMFDGQGQQATSQMTAYQMKLPIVDIAWETTWTYDLGFDASFFDNRLSLTGDYYYKETRDMLLNTKIPGFTGYSDPPRNAGTMHTNGWEFKIDWRDRIGDFNYSLGFNISDSRSIMGKLEGSVWDNDQIIREGDEYQSWYGFKTNGIFQTESQVMDAATQIIATAGLGDIEYVDISGPDGEPDGMISATYDRVVLGSSLPHYIYGGYVNLGWKNWSFGVLFNGVGQQLSRITEDMVRPFVSQWLAAPAILLNDDGSRNYWSVYNTDEQNANAKYPRLSYTSSEKTNYKMSDYWLMDGSFLRVKNISVGYSIPKTALAKTGLSGLRIYFNADDPFCFDHYLKGWDPERTASSYIARTFTLGVDIKF